VNEVGELAVNDLHAEEPVRCFLHLLAIERRPRALHGATVQLPVDLARREGEIQQIAQLCFEAIPR
jgi:hypothetical protein